jgi:hypothetical protein
MLPVDVATCLEKLSSNTWPYGLVIEVQEKGLSAPETKLQSRETETNSDTFFDNNGLKLTFGPRDTISQLAQCLLMVNLVPHVWSR